jgi:hypothetical protein
MLDLLASGWLAALGALALPLALHLLGAGHERRVAVGSVRLLRAAATRRGRRLRPSDLPRLLLRCSLLASLALALAAPRWHGRSERAATAPWVLADPRLLGPQGAERAPLAGRLEELRRQGAVVRALAPGLPPEVAAGAPAGPPPDLWSLLREADARAPAGAPVHLLVFDRADSLRGRRPALARPVEVLAAPESGENRWIESARRRSDGSLQIVVGGSAAAGTSFERLSLDAGASLAGLVVERAGQEWLARLSSGGDDGADDAVRLARPEVAAIVLRSSPRRAREAAFLRAGLEAAAHASGLELAILAAGAESATPPGSAGIQFLLDVEASAGDEAWLRRGGWRVAEAPAARTECEAQADLALGPRGVPVRLRRCAPREAEDAAARAPLAPLAVDGRGRPLLTARRVGRGLDLEMRVGLSPADSDLVLHGAFPAALAALLEARWPAPTAARAASDRRSAGVALMEPERAASSSVPTREAPASPRPESLAWLAVALLFAAERLAGWREGRGES